MTVRPLNKVVRCLANKTSWTLGGSYTQRDNNDIILKNVKLIFAPGCFGDVSIHIELNNNFIAPDPSNQYSDGYIGDDILIPIYISRILRTGDILNIYYKNVDKASIHTVEVLYEMQTLPPKSANVVKMDERKRPYNKTPGYPGAPRKGQVQVVVEKTQGQGMISKGNEHGDGGEFREAYMDGTQSRPNTNENWEDELPDFLKTDRGNYGGNNPRKRKPGRGGD